MDIHGRLLYLMVGIDKEEEVRSKRFFGWKERKEKGFTKMAFPASTFLVYSRPALRYFL